MEGGQGIFNPLFCPFFRHLLQSVSIKQGIKDGDLESAIILAFIDLHELNADETLEPLKSFCTFRVLLRVCLSWNIHGFVEMFSEFFYQ